MVVEKTTDLPYFQLKLRIKYRILHEKVQRAVQTYGQTDVLTYLRAIAHLSLVNHKTVIPLTIIFP